MESSNPEKTPQEEMAQEEKKDAPVLFVNLAEDTPCK
jgi:hypothetical protein